MPFSPQPYPLFLAHWAGDTAETGRIIGWVSPNDDHMSSDAVQPLVLFDLPDGGCTEPKYVEFEHDPCWIAESTDHAVAAMRATTDSLGTA